MSLSLRKNFLLDADETILDFVRSSKESLRYALGELSLAYSDAVYAVYKRINDGIWAEYERGEITKKQLQVQRFSRFFGQLGVTADAERANELYFGKLCRTGFLLDGAREFLCELCALGRVYLITNGTPQAQYGRLDALGIRSLFAGIFVSDEIGAAKPDPRFFAYVLEHAGLSAEECVVIGDSPSSDIAGANAAGIPCIWFAAKGRRAEGARPTAVSHSYAEILSLLRGAGGAAV